MTIKRELCGFCSKEVAAPCTFSGQADVCSQKLGARVTPPPVAVTNTPRPGDTLEQLAARTSPRGSSLKVQIGGDHYSRMAIQPITYIEANGIGFTEGNVIKYVSRWKNKNGIEDLKKARDVLDKKIAFEEAQAKSGLMEYLSALFKSV